MIFAGLSEFITGDLTDWVIDVINTIGYFGVGLLVAIENIFPPIPSEVVLPAAGFTASQGDAYLVGMLIAATVGSVVGAWILYFVARAIGPTRLHEFVVRYGRWLGVKPHDLDRAESWFDNRASVAVLVCRCIPLIRSLVSIPAGFRRMPLVRFTVFTALGSFVWNILLVGAGYALGDRWEQVADWVEVFQWVVVVAIILAVSWWIWSRFIVRSRRDRQGELT